MTGEVESADGARRSGTFPAEWGPAPGTTYSEARASWVRHKVAALRATAPYQQLARRDARLLVILRGALLNRRRGEWS
jgi:hypothetical protein